MLLKSIQDIEREAMESPKINVNKKVSRSTEVEAVKSPKIYTYKIEFMSTELRAVEIVMQRHLSIQPSVFFNI